MAEPSAKLIYDGKEIELPVVRGSEDELGIDISKLRAETGLITLDYGYMNTGAQKCVIHRVKKSAGVTCARSVGSYGTLVKKSRE